MDDDVSLSYTLFNLDSCFCFMLILTIDTRVLTELMCNNRIRLFFFLLCVCDVY